MSRQTSRVLQMAPSGAVGTTITASATPWAPSAWVEFIPSTSAGTEIAGFCLTDSAVSSNDYQLDVGVGSAGNEVVVTSLRFEVNATGNVYPMVFWLPALHTGIATGSRVAVRLKTGGSAALAVEVVLLFYTGTTDTDVSTSFPCTSPQAGANAVAITPNSTAWTNSAWFELSAAMDGAIAALSVDWAVAVDVEFDLGIGGAGNEAVITTLRTSTPSNGVGEHGTIYLPGIYQLATTTRVAVRMRKTGTSVTTWPVALITYDTEITPVDPPPDGGQHPPTSIDPDPGVSLCNAPVIYSYLHLTPVGGTTLRYSDAPINTLEDPKAPRVAENGFGAIRRALTNRSGDLRGTTFSPILFDGDRALRDLEHDDSLVNARLEAFMTTEAALEDTGSPAPVPRRVYDGKVRNVEPRGGFKMQLFAADWLQLLLEQTVLHPGSKERRPFSINRRLFTLTDFPNMGADESRHIEHPGNPRRLNTPVPIGYGDLRSDDGRVQFVYTGIKEMDGATWYEFIAYGHAPAPGDWELFIPEGPGLSTGPSYASRVRITAADAYAEYMFPGTPRWTTVFGAPNYVQINGRRYTAAYCLQSPRGLLSANGTVPLLGNIPGIEDVGDGTGDLIDSLPLQSLHLWTNFILQQSDLNWQAIPLIGSGPDAYSMLNVPSFERVRDRTVARLGGSPSHGHLGAFLLNHDGTPVTIPDIVQMMWRHGIDFGMSKDGQGIAGSIDPTTIPVRSVDEHDTLITSLRGARNRPQIRNTIHYRFMRNYVEPLAKIAPAEDEPLPTSLTEPEEEWLAADNTPVVHSGSFAKYDERPMQLDLDAVSDAETALDIATYHKDVLGPGPVETAYRGGPCEYDVELDNVVSLTHFELPSVADEDVPLRAEAITLQMDTRTAEIEGIVVSDLGSP